MPERKSVRNTTPSTTQTASQRNVTTAIGDICPATARPATALPAQSRVVADSSSHACP